MLNASPLTSPAPRTRRAGRASPRLVVSGGTTGSATTGATGVRCGSSVFRVTHCGERVSRTNARLTLGGLSRSPPARRTFACQPHPQKPPAGPGPAHSSGAWRLARRSLASARDRLCIVWRTRSPQYAYGPMHRAPSTALLYVDVSGTRREDRRFFGAYFSSETPQNVRRGRKPDLCPS